MKERQEVIVLPVVVCRNDGARWVFHDLVEFLADCEHLVDCIGVDFRAPDRRDVVGYMAVGGRTYAVHGPRRPHWWGFVIRDGLGQPLVPEAVFALAREAKLAKRRRERAAFEAANPRRQGGRRSGPYRWRRRPKTMREKRLAASWVCEDGEPRPRITVPNIVDVYEAGNRCVQRNWKKQRRTRWKG